MGFYPFKADGKSKSRVTGMSTSPISPETEVVFRAAASLKSLSASTPPSCLGCPSLEVRKVIDTDVMACAKYVRIKFVCKAPFLCRKELPTADYTRMKGGLTSSFSISDRALESQHFSAKDAEGQIDMLIAVQKKGWIEKQMQSKDTNAGTYTPPSPQPEENHRVTNGNWATW